MRPSSRKRPGGRGRSGASASLPFWLMPRLHGVDHRPAPLLPDGAALLGIARGCLSRSHTERRCGSGPPTRSGRVPRRRVRRSAAHMAPAEGELVAALGQRAVAHVAVHLQHAAEGGGRLAVRPSGRARRRRPPRGAPARPVGHRGRRPIAGPSWCALARGRAPARWSRRRTACWTPSAAPTAWRAPAAAAKRPCRSSGQGRSALSLAGRRSRLAIKWEMIGVLADDHVSNRRFRREPALDQPRRRGRLHHALLAGAAGVLRPAGDRTLIWAGMMSAARRRVSDPVQVTRAARAGLALDIDAKRGRCAGKAPRWVRRFAVRAVLVVHPSLRLQQSRPPRLAASSSPSSSWRWAASRRGGEAMALQLLDDLGQTISPGALGQEHRLQRGHVVRKRFSEARHDPNYTMFGGP